ncbi:MAG: hypothetical protein ACRDG6_07030 [Candidatus Limnocylindria bacterium]
MKGLPLAFVAVAVLTGCVAPPSTIPTSGATASPTPTKVEITSTTAAELQSVIAARFRALGAKDLTAFQATFDRTRPGFRRCQQELFDVAARQGVTARPPTVVKVESYGNGYVRAYLEDGSNGIERRYFRRDGDRWIVTEPTIDELGGARSKVVDGVRVDYWGIDEDVVDFIGREAAATREFLMPHAGSPIRDPYFVKLIPTRETAGIVACGFGAFADTRDEHAPFMGLWRLWLAPSLDRVSDYQQAVVRHEGLHYLQDQFSHRINVRLDWWLIEGWPDYVARSRGRGAIAEAVCASTIPALKRIIDGVPTEPDTPPELTGQYYGLANSMIEYVYATYGAESYWDLVALYKDNPDYRVTYPKIFKVEPDAFYQDWLAFAKRKYC